jgi:hypothetical protein
VAGRRRQRAAPAACAAPRVAPAPAAPRPLGAAALEGPATKAEYGLVRLAGGGRGEGKRSATRYKLTTKLPTSTRGELLDAGSSRLRSRGPRP